MLIFPTDSALSDVYRTESIRNERDALADRDYDSAGTPTIKRRDRDSYSFRLNEGRSDPSWTPTSARVSMAPDADVGTQTIEEFCEEGLATHVEGSDAQEDPSALDNSSDDDWSDSHPQIAKIARQRLTLLVQRFARDLEREESARLELLTAQMNVLSPMITEEFIDGVQALDEERKRLEAEVDELLASD